MTSEEETKSGTEPPKTAGKPKSKKRLIIGVVVIGVIVAGMAVASYLFLLKPGPEQVVRKYVAAEAAGDYAALRPLLTKESASYLPPADQLPKPAKDNTMPDMDIGRAKIEGHTATVPVKLKTQKATFGMADQSINVILTQEDGQWKVDLVATLKEAYRKALGGSMPSAQPEGAGPAPPAEGAPAPTPPPMKPH